MPPSKREKLTKCEQTYLDLLRHWWTHAKRPPALYELAKTMRPRRSITAIRVALCSAEEKGYCRRNDYGQFEVLP
jgi:hypothetical protein